MAVARRKFRKQFVGSPDATTGYIANVRWMPSYLPILLGAMGEYRSPGPQSTPNSYGGYFALSLDRLLPIEYRVQLWARPSMLGTFLTQLTIRTLPLFCSANGHWLFSAIAVNQRSLGTHNSTWILRRDGWPCTGLKNWPLIQIFRRPIYSAGYWIKNILQIQT